MATAANGVTVTTAPATAFNPDTDGRNVISWTITNLTSSAGNVLVNVVNLHAAGDFFGIPPGLSQTFTCASPGIGLVTIKTDSSTATVDYGITRQ